MMLLWHQLLCFFCGLFGRQLKEMRRMQQEENVKRKQVEREAHRFCL